MKRLLILICILLCASSAWGFEISGSSVPSSSSMLTLLNAATTTGAGSTVSGIGTYQNWACQINVTGAPTAVTVALEGNLIGSIYNTMGSHAMSTAEISTTQANFVVIEMPALQIRGNVTTLSGGTAPTVSLYCVGVR